MVRYQAERMSRIARRTFDCITKTVKFRTGIGRKRNPHLFQTHLPQMTYTLVVLTVTAFFDLDIT